VNPRKDYGPLEVELRDCRPGFTDEAKEEFERNELDRALRRLGRMVANEKVLKEWKRHQVFEKPSEKRRRKEREGLKRRRKEARRRERTRR